MVTCLKYYSIIQHKGYGANVYKHKLDLRCVYSMNNKLWRSSGNILPKYTLNVTDITNTTEFIKEKLGKISCWWNIYRPSRHLTC